MTAHCQQNPPAYSNWITKIKPGMPSKWQLHSEKPRDWSEDEKERVLEALSDLPQILQDEPIAGIYRLNQSSKDVLNPGSNFQDQISLYDPAFNSDQNLARVLAHELSHSLYLHLPVSDSANYAKATGWMSVRNLATGENMIVNNRDNYVEPDGEDGPSEDFCNNIEYFLFNPSKLKQITPNAYDWIQKKFGDKFKTGRGF